MSTRLLQRLGKGGIAVFRVRVLGTRVPFCANAIQRQSPFHHSPLTDLSIPSATTIKEQWCDEETEDDLVDAGIFTDQVHPAIGHGIMQRDTKKLRETIAALVDDKEQLTKGLHLAIHVGNEAAAVLLLSAGADLEMEDLYLCGMAAAPYRAIHKRMLPLVRLMWDATAYLQDRKRGRNKIRRTQWLGIAAECGHADVVREMMRWSGDWDYDQALWNAAYNWHYETVKTLASAHDYSQKAIQEALGHVCDVNGEIDFDIMCCDKTTDARHREMGQVIRWLVDAGADPDNAKTVLNG
ncbi:hypothetical protein LMH87_002334 [Akanthomyces muscarius]|uniref:Ankyrin repeat protein n=1 Tax=Akanthomyces muscarius TaxID=2231603 RepID=A0A9W8UJ52_AKAMU|nr:hypothetical protein LMH87_002334 [Akanthomyces muscarius]KAJ4147832.1 hypothetical protein LMH87_002334 [Akanthomyces muscarius]